MLNLVDSSIDVAENPFARNDKNHTSLGPHGHSVIYGFVFTTDQVCSERYLTIGSMVGTYFSHGFGVYLHVFGV